MKNIVIRRNQYLIAILVPSGRAEGLVTSVLLHRRAAPATEGHKVAEVVDVVVVCVPQREVREASGAASDGVPLRCRGVDTDVNATSLSLSNHSANEIGIGSLVA